jgi:hypothetical protein
MKVKEVVELNRSVRFERAIQLSMFREPVQNKSLCGWFVFTKYSNDQRKELGSVQWLERMRRGLQLPETGSIACLIANYGHGKSHFGVLAANCFGMANDSDEFKIALGQLRHSAPNEADAFEDFRTGQYKKPYFVLCLQGDNMPTLRQAVFQEVEKELHRHDETRDIKPPLWHQDAMAWVRKLSADEITEANKWLESHGWDLPYLEKRLEERDARPEVRERCRELSKHVEGHTVDFGAESSVQDLLQWILDTFCIEDGPFSGMVVLFDEFHVFIESYAKNPEKGNPLQNMLNVFEIKRNQGRSLFCALTTMDPTAAAQTALRRTGGDGQSIGKELNRIGTRIRFKCEMEFVLDSMLQQQTDQWKDLYEECRGPIGRADKIIRQVYKDRFKDLNLSDDQVFERITKGCFPLHPLTTCLLSNIRFRAVQNPRSVLGFVQDQYKALADAEAVLGKWPNWVYGTDCFDTFHEMFDDRYMSRYHAVDDRLGGDATDEQLRVLVSMLLIMAGVLPTVEAGYERLVAELAGLELETATQTLEELYKNGYIEREPLTNGYSLSEVGQAKADFRKAISETLAVLDLRQFTAKGLTDRVTAKNGPLVNHLQPRPISVEWGEKGDWGFTRYLATRAQMNEDSLLPLLRTWSRDPENGTRDWERAIEIFFIPEDSGDVLWAREHGPTLIADAAGIERPPILLSVLKSPTPELFDSLREFIAADSLSEEVRSTLGDQYTKGRDDVIKRLTEVARRELVDSRCMRLVVPGLKDMVEALDTPNADGLRKVILQKAYRGRVPKFSSISGVGANNHRRASIEVSQRLVSGGAKEYLNPTGAQSQAADILRLYLFESWGMVDDQYGLQYPSNESVAAMWELLSEDISPSAGLVHLRGTMKKLANPPYGLDTCTLSLVVSGWLGWNKSKLKLTGEAGRALSWDELRNHSQNSYLSLLASLRIRRQDVGELKDTIEEIFKKHSQAGILEQSTAQEWITALEEYVKVAGDGDEFKARSAELASRLTSDSKRAKDYASIVAKASGVRPGTDLALVYSVIEQLQNAEPLGLVRSPDWQLPSVFLTEFVGQISDWIPDLLVKAAKVKQREHVALVQKQLETQRRKFETLGLASLVGAANEALKTLEETNRGFDRDVKQKTFVEKLRACKPAQLTLNELRIEESELRAESESLGELIDQVQVVFSSKMSSISMEIEELLARHEVLYAQLDAAKTYRAVERVARDCRDFAGRLAGSPELLVADKLEKQVENTERLFKELEAIVERIPTGRDELERAIRTAEELAMHGPSTGIREYAPTVVQRLRREFDLRQARAKKEFDGHVSVLTRKASIDDIDEARRYLRKPDEYLSSDLVEQLEQLRKDVDALLEVQRVDHIKSLAKKVKDKSALKDLIEFLNKLSGGE